MLASAVERPNFLIFMTEQHRGDCLGIDGHPVLLTPNMDEIGGKGCRFSRAYSSCPVCVPARRSFLTGQFPSTHGFFGNCSIEWDGPTLAGELSKAGYHTSWVGRSMHQTPPRKRYGFDHVVMNDHREPFDDYEEWMAAHQSPGGGGYHGTGVMHNDWTARPWHMDESLHHTNWTVNLALDFLRKRDPCCPFLLCVSFVAARGRWRRWRGQRAEGEPDGRGPPLHPGRLLRSDQPRRRSDPPLAEQRDRRGPYDRQQHGGHPVLGSRRDAR